MRRSLRVLFNGLTLGSLALLLAFLSLPLQMTWGQWTINHSSGWFTVQNGAGPPLIHWRGWWVMDGCSILPLLWIAFRPAPKVLAGRGSGGRDRQPSTAIGSSTSET